MRPNLPSIRTRCSSRCPSSDPLLPSEKPATRTAARAPLERGAGAAAVSSVIAGELGGRRRLARSSFAELGHELLPEDAIDVAPHGLHRPVQRTGCNAGELFDVAVGRLANELEQRRRLG